jgi:hypothetical protein
MNKNIITIGRLKVDIFTLHGLEFYYEIGKVFNIFTFGYISIIWDKE